ncbi:uncharacterized protein [Amphiura filiformis]|uniref:uncharacterized protein n=1 Tax=Amphiura filiformis TaxID=82378 RepID=UPI003B214361
MKVVLVHVVIGSLMLLEVGKQQDYPSAEGYTLSNEFIFAMPRPQNSLPHVIITTSSSLPIVTTLAIPGMGITVTKHITKYSPADIVLPDDVRFEKDGKQNKTVIVTSSGSVSVYAFDNEYCCGDGLQVLPSSQLGTRYYIANYTPYPRSSPPNLVISALTSNTSVYIKTKTGPEQSAVLSRFESYRFTGNFIGSDNYDLSGTLVESNYPIAVISSGKTVVPEVGGSSHSGLADQMPPVVLTVGGKISFLYPF